MQIKIIRCNNSKPILGFKQKGSVKEKIKLKNLYEMYKNNANSMHLEGKR